MGSSGDFVENANITHKAEKKEQKLLPFYPIGLLLCQNIPLRKLSEIFTNHTMVLKVIFVSFSMKVLEIKKGKLKREVLVPQYIRNKVKNSEVTFDTFTDGCLNSNLVKLTEIKLTDFI